ncbi:MAG TPA: methyltransferase domain-containing protein [Ilumatobacteraceae bacterium]|nr:methyltransferase domain-containing protein [Ilumatobacteraceae bacterium]
MAHGAHHHHHGGEQSFDWQAMADSVELDGLIVLPLLDDVMKDVGAHLHLSEVQHVLDVGAGPGVIAGALAAHMPRARVTAIDSSPEMLARAAERAGSTRVKKRLSFVVADLDAPLPPLEPAELIVASMVLHHVADPVASLRRLHELLVPGGVLVMLEFAGPPAVLPPDDPMLQGGAWTRLERAAAGVIRERLGLDPWTLDWPSMLTRAGYADVRDRTRAAYHSAPLDTDGRRWIAKHVNRGLSMAGERIPATDLAPLQELADSAPVRRDLFLRAERRVLMARRSLF